MYVELNIDALVGPSHHFGGVGVGNVASQEHKQQASNPRLGALEGLRKAKLVAELGVPQYVLPPPRRPLRRFLESLGFSGDFQTQCAQARQVAPSAYSAVFSSASMWAANAATVAPECDSRDHHTHITLANLSSSWHRMFEHADRYRQLERMFAGSPLPVRLHAALPPLVPLRDEGAANHMRLSNAGGDTGLHVFVYGEADHGPRPSRHLARQTLAAGQAVARLHGLDSERTFFLQQHPDAIDAGVFHNDVIATSHGHVLLMHELAFLNAEDELARLACTFEQATGSALKIICVRNEQLSLQDAVRSYLFNSQLLNSADDPARMVMVCAAQCRRMPHVRRLIEQWIGSTDNPISDVHYVSLDQSMSGGGGPACLRLRLALPAAAIDSFALDYRLTPTLAAQLEIVISKCYPDCVTWDNLASSENLERYESAHRELEKLFST